MLTVDALLFGASLFRRGALTLILPGAIPFQPAIEEGALLDIELQRLDPVGFALDGTRAQCSDEGA